MSHSIRVAAFAFLSSIACSHTDKPPVQEPPFDSDGMVSPEPTSEQDPPDAEPPADAAAAFVAGPGGVPLPGDATARTDMPNAGGKMFVFEIPREKDAVIEELRTNLAADGWTIDSEEVSPRFQALRLKVSKAGAIVDTRVTGEEGKTAIIITLKEAS